ncbi:MAG: TetR/AcrR family transcriptional regulator [Actinobacteria bacterium]|nr:TetR/AcrR family transcriptional regulator [Actinomycetota bacterium]
MDKEPTTATKQRMLDAGLTLLLEQGYHGVGVQAVLDAAQAPKGSFYHHFNDKEDFALQVVDAYMTGVHAALDASLSDSSRAPLDRIRGFFELVSQGYEHDGYLGCLLGGLGQELSGASDVFATKIDWCLGYIAGRLAEPLGEARARGDLTVAEDPAVLAQRLVECWEGAALHSRLLRDPSPLPAMLDFYFRAITRVPDDG